MPKIDRALAARTLADLPLSRATRRFADWWLSMTPGDGRLPNQNINPSLPGDLASSTMACEVRPWASVLCRFCGDDIARALGIDLAGRDMLGLLAPQFRPTRLARYINVVQGGMQFSHRNVSTVDHTTLQIQELMLPYPDLRIEPWEQGAGLTIAFLDPSSLPLGKRVLISQGALRLADDPYFVDLRQLTASSLAVATCPSTDHSNSKSLAPRRSRRSA